MHLYPCQQGLENVWSLAIASIAKHIQRYTYVLLDQQAYCVRSPTTCYNSNSSHLTIKRCGCEIITLTPHNERGRNQYYIAKLPDPFLCGVAQ